MTEKIKPANAQSTQDSQSEQDVQGVQSSQSTQSTQDSKKQASLVAIIVTAVIAIAGIALWIFQLTDGMVNTNMRNLDSWGLYIIMFMLFVGLSAGGLIISSVPRVFGIRGFGAIGKVATWVSICCTVLAVAFVVVDLGGPLRLWELVAYANISSPLMWDIIVLTLYLIISIVYLWATIRTDNGTGSPKVLRILSVFALIAAVLVHTVTAWIFGLQIAHEFWYTALLGPWFVSSALVSGLALVLVVAAILRKSGRLELENKDYSRMVMLLGVFTAVDLYFFGCDLLTSGFPGGTGADIVALLTTGVLAPYFWFEVVSGAITMIIAFSPSLRRPSLIVLASVISIVAILCKRIQLLIGGFQIANIQHATVSSGPALSESGQAFANVAPALVYFPSALEFGIVIGVLSLGAFLLLLGLRMLPLLPANLQN
ncbi:MAG: polysulfide reductase NrfD [Coriobacteriales bacterium]|jgi:molybdopterin-containing oxidoreductase family membrane subunit|nr:polysulfide reductase NrfD [Coriobacteriales bacterium]